MYSLVASVVYSWVSEQGVGPPGTVSLSWDAEVAMEGAQREA